MTALPDKAADTPRRGDRNGGPGAMEGIAPWIWGAGAAVLALAGLFMAAGARDLPFQLAGYAFFVFGILFDFLLIKRYAGGEHGE